VLDAEPSTRACTAPAARTDKALHLSPGELDAYRRVGALDRRLAADARGA